MKNFNLNLGENEKKRILELHFKNKYVIREQEEKVFKDLFNAHVKDVINKNIEKLTSNLRVSLNYIDGRDDSSAPYYKAQCFSKSKNSKGGFHKKKYGNLVVGFYPKEFTLEFENGGNPIILGNVGPAPGSSACVEVYKATIDSKKEYGSYKLDDDIINQIKNPANEDLKDWLSENPDIIESLKTIKIPIKFSDANSKNQYGKSPTIEFHFRILGKYSKYIKYGEYFPLNWVIGKSPNKGALPFRGKLANLLKEKGGWNLTTRGEFFSRNTLMSFGWDDKLIDQILNKNNNENQPI